MFFTWYCMGFFWGRVRWAIVKSDDSPDARVKLMKAYEGINVIVSGTCVCWPITSLFRCCRRDRARRGLCGRILVGRRQLVEYW